MNIIQLQHFAAAVKFGSYAAAGDAIFVTPSSIARSVRKLEQEYRVELMRKSGTKAVPTDLGLVFYEKVEAILEDIADLSAMANRASQDGRRRNPISVAIVESFYRGRVVGSSLLRELEDGQDDVSLSIVYGPSGVCLAAAEDGCVDAAVVLGPVERVGMISIQLFAKRLFVALSRHNVLAVNGSISVHDLATSVIGQPHDMRFCHPLIVKAFGAQHVAPHFTAISPSVQSHRDFLSDGGALFVFPEPEITALYPNAVFLPLCDGDLTVPVHLVYYKEKTCYALNVLKKHLASLQEHEDRA